MARVLTIALIVVALVAGRLLLPPAPGLLKIGLERWGKRATITLCAISLIGATLVIFISRR
jgi:hypothetical protein